MSGQLPAEMASVVDVHQSMCIRWLLHHLVDGAASNSQDLLR